MQQNKKDITRSNPFKKNKKRTQNLDAAIENFEKGGRSEVIGEPVQEVVVAPEPKPAPKPKAKKSKPKKVGRPAGKEKLYPTTLTLTKRQFNDLEDITIKWKRSSDDVRQGSPVSISAILRALVQANLGTLKKLDAISSEEQLIELLLETYQ